MKPIHDHKLRFKVSELCELAGTRIADLPIDNSYCLRWILSWCPSKRDDPSSCAARAGCKHLAAADISDDTATKIAAALKPGVDKFVRTSKPKK